jgi:hypothetical protein
MIKGPQHVYDISYAAVCTMLTTLFNVTMGLYFPLIVLGSKLCLYVWSVHRYLTSKLVRSKQTILLQTYLKISKLTY